MQNPRDSRATTSCTECQRRKQKCSREWPCNHCQARKVPHLCQFGQKKADQKSPSGSSRESRAHGQKRSRDELTEIRDSPALSRRSSGEDPQDGLRAWGYMPGHVHYKIGTIDSRDANHPTVDPGTNEASEVDKVLHAVPPRSLTDAIVNHFLTVVNFRYNSIYAPTFTGQYVQWWTDRANGRCLSAEFTCLLLRICAYSVQYLTIPLRRTIEFEMACSSQVLTERFANAAEQLSAGFSASKTSLERVQEQFMKGAWLKSESKIVESWHALGCTIREAQELGLDKDTGLDSFSEFEIELRRRLWTLLYIWDWQMSAWLGRPHLIDQKNCSFTFPTLRLDEAVEQPNLVSPFAHMSLQAQLARRITHHMGDIQVISQLSGEQVLEIEAECEKFQEELPQVFRMKNPDFSLDDQYPYFVFQRCQMHVIVFMTMFDVLKPYLTRDTRNSISTLDKEFRTKGVDISLELLKVARHLFDHEFPINAKFHLVVFCIFDTATILCSAIIHDSDHLLPRRDEIMDAIEAALDMLHQLSLTTKIGASSYHFLFKLTQSAPALSQRSSMKRRKLVSSPDSSVLPAASQDPPIDPLLLATSVLAPTVEAATTLDPVPPITTTDDLSFDLDAFMQQNPFEGASSANLDLGGLEQIWGWDNLNLDEFLGMGQGGVTSSSGV
ncbi:hypothetical protein EJ04DRAFT_575383 [Polyplosphaeria fusca]|uniref:Zn(2)-C6 fungal-type domain-containing protein n=1 Tax=Polyplosphaeria fusca TaxID=682080 RepID=A0A9P4V1J5_9PLEO|nr:hypothetical protein EJ04DRAFT_575383 [Polyplosphaeria fusca]